MYVVKRGVCMVCRGECVYRGGVCMLCEGEYVCRGESVE